MNIDNKKSLQQRIS